MLISSVWRGIGRVYFSVGLLFGGVIAALSAALLGACLFHWWIPREYGPAIVIALTSALSFASPALLQARYLQNRRQVPEAVRALGPRVGAFQFGFEMGTAARTFMPTTMPLVLLSGLILVGSLPLAILVGLGFGVGRTAVPLLRSYDDIDVAWSTSFDRWSHRIWIAMVTCGVSGLVGATGLSA